jgi:hypothetical protein
MSILTFFDPITPQLIAHVSGGVLGIGSGVVALSARKGAHLHRLAGKIFLASMLIMASMGAYLAVTLRATAFPRLGTAIVGVLTFNLVASAWLTVRRKGGGTGTPELISMLINVAAMMVALALAVAAATQPQGVLDGVTFVPYVIVAAAALFVSVLDVRVYRRGGVSGVARLSRHLWRMCFALFLALAFSLIGQQRIMPAFVHGSPTLTVLTIAPLFFLIFWMVRVRLLSKYKLCESATTDQLAPSTAS